MLSSNGQYRSEKLFFVDMYEEGIVQGIDKVVLGSGGPYDYILESNLRNSSMRT